MQRILLVVAVTLTFGLGSAAADLGKRGGPSRPEVQRPLPRLSPGAPVSADRPALATPGAGEMR